MVTLEDIALEVGCSVNTVSRALNNKPDVSKETKKRVLEAATRLGYVPNTLAKSLVTKVSGTIGVIVPTVADPLYAAILAHIEKEVIAYNYSIILAQSRSDADIGIDPVEMLYRKRVDGLLVVPSNQDEQGLEAINRYNLPIVCLLHDLPGWRQDFVGIDEEEAAYGATRHLLSLGRRSIVFVKAAARGDSGVSGYRRALAEYGAAGDGRVAVAAVEPQCGYDCCQTLLRQQAAFDGLILPHDMLFPGTYTALRLHGLSCPEDVAVVGYGNSELCPYFQVPLTSIAVPLKYVSTEALRLLIDIIRSDRQEGEPWICKRIFKDPKLIVRRSCGARGD